MPEPAPTTQPLDEAERALLERDLNVDNAESLLMGPHERAVIRKALGELGDRRRLGAFYGLRGDDADADDVILSLADARDLVREEVIALAANQRGYGEWATDLDALTRSLERLERLVDLEQARGRRRNIELEALKPLEDVAKAAREVLVNLNVAGIEREHFAGRLEALLAPLEDLDRKLKLAGQ